MTLPIPTETFPVEQPPEWQVCVDDIFIKQMFMAKRGHLVPQHVHKYAHHSMLARGSVRLWVDDVLVGDFKAPMPILIVAGKAHTFQALEDESLIYCIHNVTGRGGVEILAERNF